MNRELLRCNLHSRSVTDSWLSFAPLRLGIGLIYEANVYIFNHSQSICRSAVSMQRRIKGQIVCRDTVVRVCKITLFSQDIFAIIICMWEPLEKFQGVENFFTKFKNTKAIHEK